MSSKTPFILSFMAATAATVALFAISLINKEDQLAYQEMLADPSAGGGPFDGAALEMVIAFWLFLLVLALTILYFGLLLLILLPGN